MAGSSGTTKAVAHGIEGVRALTGQVLGPTEWRTVTQEMINAFAQITGDHQWIHVDVERAERESPYGRTIAHGNLTLSLIDGFRDQLSGSTGFVMGVNYGWNRVRFPAAVPSEARVRATAQIVEVTDVGAGWLQVVTRFTVEADGSEKPVCVADSVVRMLADADA